MANPVRIPATVESIDAHGDGVYAVSLRPAKRLPKFRPGQFLHLAIDPFDPEGGFWPESRVFSIASAPASTTVTIVYSVKGHYTSRMRNELAPGKEVWIKLPYGDFAIQSSSTEDRDVVLVAGGTGVSPYVPFIETELASARCGTIRLVYGVRRPEHLLFAETMSRGAKTCSRFSIDLFVEQAAEEELIEGATHRSGAITLEHLLHVGSTANKPVFFLSGPPGMIRTFKLGLVSNGVSPSDIRIDEWE
jgi:ferredoxin-NADP reductase